MKDPISLTDRALGFWNRYKQLGNINDLEESISLNREALTLRPPGHPDRPSSLNSLAVDLNTRYEQLGKAEDLEESISLHHAALTLRPNNSNTLNNLAAALMARYRRMGKKEDLEESISLFRNVLALHAVDHSDRSTFLSNLASVLGVKYRQSGDIQDLEESVSLQRGALALRPPGHPERSQSLNNLANILWARYPRLGNADDLEESIALNREALFLRPPGNPNRFYSLANLSISLITRYRQLGKIKDLEESILLYRDALDLCPSNHSDRSKFLSNLANALRDRYEKSGEMEDLEEAIMLDRKALSLYPPGHLGRSQVLNNLATALRARYKQLDTFEDLEESISLNRNALVLRPPGHPLRSDSLNDLARVLRTRYQRSGEAEDAQEMFKCYEQAASDSTSYLRYQLMAAIEWAEVAMKHKHQSTLKAYTTSLKLLQESLIIRPDVEAQHAFLATGAVPQSLASDAASAAIQAGDLELAVEFLEQGRAMLWSQIDGYQYPLEQLRQVEGGEELADRLETLSAELQHLVLLTDRTASLHKESSTQGPSFDARIKQHRMLSEEWEALVRRIREKSGFTHFLQIPPFDTLQSAAAEGPVVFINISDYRSDAIIITINNPPILVPLSTLKPADLRDQTRQLTSNQGIIGVLRYLWNYIVAPVATRLEELGVEKKSRIWWCPTAELCALPLHAAGPYRSREPNLLDIYTSSYTSTLSSLIRARSNISQLRSGAPKLLVIGQPHETLQKVGDEVAIIKEYTDGAEFLLGDEASHEAVLEGLKQHSWVHFACHGHLGDDAQPFKASFELHDGRRLTLLELIQARLPNAESAFLAACHSAAGDSRTPDENIHLSAALQFCGFRSVVGTLWEMYDEDGPMMSREFYRYMFRDPERIDFRDSAYALSSAVREMRKARLPPERWVMFVHIGA